MKVYSLGEISNQMKSLLSSVLLLGLVACSPQEQPPAKPEAKQHYALHEYSVTFAAVKIPDETLKQLGLPPFEGPHTEESDQKLAAYVVAHPGDFSIAGIKGNCLPVVWNNGETHVKLLLDPEQEQKDLETLGMMTRGFDIRVSVRDEQAVGQVYCDWFCCCGIHSKEQVRGSTDRGMTGGSLTGLITVGQTYIRPLLQGNGVSLWMMGALNRNTN